MKNKLECEVMTSEQFSNVLSMDQQSPKGRRDSVAPKIVVCPPMEEITEPATRRSLFKAFSRKLSRRAADDESQGSSSSNDSMSSGRNDSSYSVSDSGSDGSENRRSRHRSIMSLRRVFQSFSISPRSQSCSPTDRQRQPKKQQQPKRILRSPVTYTYVRGLSGLPTQRVPRHTVGCAR